MNSLKNAFDIINCLKNHEGELTLNEISQSIGLPNSTTHRTLTAMKELGYITQNPNTSCYDLDIVFYSIGLSVQQRHMQWQRMFPYAEYLTEKYGESTEIAIWDLRQSTSPNYINVVQSTPSARILNIASVIGRRTPAHCTSSGKCLLAFSPKSLVSQYSGCNLIAYTTNTITDWRHLNSELKLIREQGYALDREEFELGIIGISVPIFGSENEGAVAAIAMTTPKSRFRQINVEELVFDLQRSAAQIRLSLSNAEE